MNHIILIIMKAQCQVGRTGWKKWRKWMLSFPEFYLMVPAAQWQVPGSLAGCTRCRRRRIVRGFLLAYSAARRLNDANSRYLEKYREKVPYDQKYRFKDLRQSTVSLHSGLLTLPYGRALECAHCIAIVLVSCKAIYIV